MRHSKIEAYFHLVWATKGRDPILDSKLEPAVYHCIQQEAQGLGCTVLALNGMPDHVHILIGLKPNIALSDLVKDVKVASSRLVNDKRWVRGRFNWQEGFGAFSCSHSHLSKVASYIENQERHHARRSFRDEYLSMLRSFQIEHDDRYLFKWIEG